MAAVKINGVEMAGIEMADGFLRALRLPAPLKDYISNTSALEHGKRYINGVTPKLNERSVTLGFYVKGATRGEFDANLEAFYRVLYNGDVSIQVPSRSNDIYHLKYINAAEYAQNRAGTFATLSVKFNEPNPANRS